MGNDACDLPVLTLSGRDPTDWGRQHGAALAGPIRELVGIRRMLLGEALVGWSAADIDRLCDDQLAALEQRWPQTLAEVRGISETSGASLRDMVILNAYTDLKDFAEQSPPRPIEAGCSALAAIGPHAGVAGQTWDMHASAEPFVVLLELPEAPIPTRVLTLSGCVGLCGVNAAGVSVMINNLTCGQPDRGGLIWNGLVRLLLTHRSAEAAAAALAANLPTSGHHYLISDADTSISIETTGTRCDVVARVSRSKPGVIAHANHYLGHLIATEVADRRSPTTDDRQAALERFRAGHPIETLTNAMLAEQFLERGPLCECVFLPDPTEPHAGATCGGMMVDYLAGTACAFRGRYAAERAHTWRFGDA